ncbi:MAG: DUF7544 domain-containing protein [Halobacteriota archaeon]
MPWDAIDALDDAREATQSLLLPVDATRWLKLALIAFFVGGGAGTSGQGNVNFGQAAPTGDVSQAGDLPLPMLSDAQISQLVLVALAALVVFVALGVVYAVISAVMEFVLVEGLRTREIRIRRPFSQHLGPGLQLFLFRLLIILAVLAVVGIPIGLVILGGVGISAVLFLLVLPLVAVFAVVGLAAGLVGLLTTDFVVPTMMREDRGVISGWKRVWPLVRTRWKQVGLYVVARFVLGIIAGIAVGLVTLLLALVLALPFLLAGGLIYVALMAMGGPGLAGWILLGIVGAVFLLAVLVVALLVQVPVVTFFRYYALFVLGLQDPQLALVADLRSDSEGGEGHGSEETAPSSLDEPDGDERTTGDADTDDTEEQTRRDEDIEE